MRHFPFVWRACLVFAIFVAAGVFADRAIATHEAARGIPEITTRMAAAMGGLFTGGVAACLVGITLFLLRSRDGRPEA